MKLIIQIPCFNEQGQLPLTLSGLPRQVDGFDEVQWLVIDDGSTDRTLEVARSHGVDHIVRLTNHKGLAAAFQAGLDAGLKLGADVIVNTDADNQYDGADVPRLVAPILRGAADMVVGDRQGQGIEEFSAGKRALQRVGSWVVRQASATHLPDATSGFRAYNREAALQVQAVSRFTYTLETTIQAGKLMVAMEHVPVRTNPRTRESRLFPSSAAYVRRNALSIFRIYSQYQPLKVFWGGALIMGLCAFALFIRFIVIFVQDPSTAGRGHVQSLIAGAVLFIGAILLGALG
ncbi:MAG TPA: glycosyltransferase family 2 protein, partial [Solirubrobacteraceae bacterium]|nr:glycosyltransferase family 2 protein [Solirubrobacteraceae bacterium]